jgi:4-hydroxy-tetrahydrodipicolinate reductase
MSAPAKRVALVGMGKMGRVLEELAPERGWEVVARIHSDENANGKGITRESLGGATVAIDFTVPAAAVANAKAAVQAGCPIVVGTTGWYDALPELSAWVIKQNGAMLTAPNFSIGVNAFERIAALAGKILGGAPSPGFDAHLVETHHSAKKDAPSGTALKLAKAVSDAGGRTVAITSVRTGFVPGTHELVFDAPFETIRLTHVARDRRVFAEGALVAAEWLAGRRGVFTMRDVLDHQGNHGNV